MYDTHKRLGVQHSKKWVASIADVAASVSCIGSPTHLLDDNPIAEYKVGHLEPACASSVVEIEGDAAGVHHMCTHIRPRNVGLNMTVDPPVENGCLSQREIYRISE